MSESSQGNQSNAVVYLGVFALLTLIFASIAAINLPEPWSDEAMLAFNFVGQKSSVFNPLPFYEQAAPIGYVLTIRAVVAGLNSLEAFDAMRMVSLSAFCLGMMSLSFAFLPRRRWTALIVLFAVAFGSPWIWQYAVEIKHYSFEFLATCLIIISGRWFAISGSTIASITFFAVCVIAPVFAFTSPLVVVASAAAALSHRLICLYRHGAVTSTIEALDPRHCSAGLLRVVIVSGLAILSVATFHAFVNRGLVYYQMVAYDEFYKSGLVDFGDSIFENIEILSRFPEYILQPLGQSAVRAWLVDLFADSFLLYAAIAVASFALLVAILLLAFQSAPYFVLVMIFVLIFAVVLNVLGMLAFSAYRHFFFVTPLVLVLVAFAGERIMVYPMKLLPRNKRRPIAIVGMIVLVTFSAYGSYDAAKRRSPELLPVIDEIVAAKIAAPVWIHSGVQPMALMVLPDNLEILNLLDNRSRETAWMNRRSSPFPTNIWASNPGSYDFTTEAVDLNDAIWMVFPIVAGLDVEAYIALVEKNEKECALHMRTNGTELFLCNREH